MISPEDDFINELAAKLRPALLQDTPDELNPEAVESIVERLRQPVPPRWRVGSGITAVPQILVPPVPSRPATLYIVRRIVLTVFAIAISFPLADLLFPDLGQQFAMSIGVGAIVLVIQFLIDFERRLLGVELVNVSCLNQMQGIAGDFYETMRLASSAESAGLPAAAINPGAPPLVRAIAKSEIDRVSEFLRGLADKQATYDGEDRDWLLGLTRCAVSSIDAISIPEVDAAGDAFHSFWESELGRRYLALQREAVQRGARVRRVFVTARDEIAGDPALQRMYRIHQDMGIDVRLLNPSSIPHEIRTSLFDFTLFDGTLSYERTPAAHVEEGENPMILSTRLILRGDKVKERVERYRRIWDSALSWPYASGSPAANLYHWVRGSQ